MSFNWEEVIFTFLLAQYRFQFFNNIDFPFSNRSDWFIATRCQYEILEKRKLQKSNSAESTRFSYSRQ